MVGNMRILLLILGIMSLINVVLLLRASNPSIGVIMQICISIFFIVYALLFNRIPNKIHITMGISCLLPAALMLFLFIYGNVSTVDYNEDVIIVLGAGVVGENVTRPLANRLDAAFYYWQKNPDAYIIVCGGLGSRAVITEAEAMARFLTARGVPRERILLEERSTSTYENLTFAKKILDEHFQDGFRAVLVTNDFHLYRAIRIARNNGIYVNRLGAYTNWFSRPVYYIRETMAVINMWLFM